MITLYLCRHAIAREARADQSDADRPLTAAGTRKFHRAAEGFLRAVDPASIGLLLTSPLLRARQTAQILALLLKARGSNVTPRATPALGSAASLTALLREIRAAREPGGVIAVGHEPTLSRWVGQLCFGKPGSVAFKKGAIAAIELPPRSSRARLLFLLQPAILRAI